MLTDVDHARISYPPADQAPQVPAARGLPTRSGRCARDVRGQLDVVFLEGPLLGVDYGAIRNALRILPILKATLRPRQ